MKGTGSFLNLYLYEGVVDFRKSIDGLSAIVESEINVNIFSDSAFIFVSRSRCRIKVLYWDKTGFALWHKRLEKDRFILPKSRASKSINISTKELERLLEGLDIFKVKPHQNICFSRVS